MFDFSVVISQVPVNSYVVIGCCVTGWVMKKFLPADNKIIPLVLTVLGAVLLVMIEGFSVQSIVLGAFTGSAATGLHQIYAQLMEGRDLASASGDGCKAEDFKADPVAEEPERRESL